MPVSIKIWTPRQTIARVIIMVSVNEKAEPAVSLNNSLLSIDLNLNLFVPFIKSSKPKCAQRQKV